MFTDADQPCCHGGHYTDAMGMYRAYRDGRCSPRLDLDRDEGYAPEKCFRTMIGVEPLLRPLRQAAPARDRDPGAEPARIGGVRKLQVFRWGGGYLAQIVRELWNWR